MQTGCEAAQSSLSCVTILTIVLVPASTQPLQTVALKELWLLLSLSQFIKQVKLAWIYNYRDIEISIQSKTLIRH